MQNAPLLFLIFSLVSGICKAQEKDEIAQKVIMMTDYIAGDYGEAVAKGAIKNPGEYQEMLDFAATSARLFQEEGAFSTLSQSERIAAQKLFDQLQASIKAKHELAEVRRLVDELGKILAPTMATSPSRQPSFELARTSYQQNCASCHGSTGHGDGPLAVPSMEPSPRNFHDANVMMVSSPFKFFNIQTLGVSGTSMASYRNTLDPETRWSLAYYLAGLRHQSASSHDPQRTWEGFPQKLKDFLLAKAPSWQALSLLKDQDLEQLIKEIGPSWDQIQQSSDQEKMAILRTVLPYVRDGKALFAGNLETAIAGVVKAKKLTNDARLRAEKGQTREAEMLLLSAYLEAFEKAETILNVKQRKLVSDVEALFIQIRNDLRNQDLKSYRASEARLLAALDQAETFLSESGSKSNQGFSVQDFQSSFVIIVREGLEAFLVIAALLAVMKTFGQPSLTKLVHAGWTSAIVAGFATYGVTSSLVKNSGATREMVEAVSSLLAASILIYVAFWLLNQAERSKWDSFIKSGVRAAISNQKRWAIFGLAFIAVYREAAETVLFYQALVSSSQDTLAVLSGFVGGSLVIFCLSWSILYFGLRLPLKQFFKVTSVMMVGIALILVGKGIHELVEAGKLEPTLIGAAPTLDVLGIYPHLESLLAQILISIGCVALWWLSRRSTPAKA